MALKIKLLNSKMKFILKNNNPKIKNHIQIYFSLNLSYLDFSFL
jgi:hypothetical protein